MSLVQRWQSVSPSVLLPPVRGLLDFLALPHKHGPREFTRLLGLLTAEAALLAGWLSFRLDNRGDAQLYWKQASEIGHVLNDPSTTAHVFLAQSSLVSGLAAGGPGGGSLAIALLDEAERTLPRGVSISLLRARVLARRAEEHAAAGNGAAAERDLEQTEHGLAATPAKADRFASWGPIRLAGYRGSCAVLLGSGRQAQLALESALEGAPPGPGQAILLADLGAAYAEQGYVEEACTVLREAVSVSAQAQTLEFVRRVMGVRQRHLARWLHEPAVSELDERLLTLV